MMTLLQAKREFEKAQESVRGILLVVLNSDRNRFQALSTFQDLYYAYPNITQTKGYLAKSEKLVAELSDMPEIARQLGETVGRVMTTAEVAVKAKNDEEAAKVARKSAREARLADKGDNNLIAAMAGPRAEYKVRCVQHLNDSVAEIAAKLELQGFDIEKVYPYPATNAPRHTAVSAIADRRFADKFFKSVSNRGVNVIIVALREDVAEVIDAAADKMVSEYFDGYIYKLSKKIGKPIKTAKHEGSLWTNCTLTIECEDGDKQVWHTHCIFHRSCLGKVFNQWPTRKVE